MWPEAWPLELVVSYMLLVQVQDLAPGCGQVLGQLRLGEDLEHITKPLPSHEQEFQRTCDSVGDKPSTRLIIIILNPDL